MDKVEDLNSDFNDLYYDREEYHNEVIYEVGVQDGIAKGIQEKSLEVAKNMLLKNLNISLISDITG